MAPTSTDELFSTLNPQASILIGLLITMATVIIVIALAYLGYQYFVNLNNNKKESCTALNSSEWHPVSKTHLKISHSLPDIKREVNNWNNQTSHKVLRQTTLPVVPNRHHSFQRQLSQNLDLSDIKFAVCPVVQQHRPSNTSSYGAIKPELYRPDLVQQSSIDSCPSEIEYGKLHFTLKYDHDVEGLVVKLLQAKDLPVRDSFGPVDPYVKLRLLPDRKKCQTKVYRQSLNPVFNETFVFTVSYRELRTRTLQMSVYDLDRFSRNDLIGHVVLRGLLDNCDLSQEVEYLMDILHRKQEKLNLGELMLSMCYLPTAGRLIVTVIKACNLRAMDITGSSDPYVKVILTCMGKRIKKKKTSVKKATLNPIYNEALVFDIPVENSEDVSLVVNVIDYDRVGSNEMMGGCVIGSNVIGIGRDHWQEMLDNPRMPVAQWYQLTTDGAKMIEDQSPTECHSGHLGVPCLRCGF